VVVGEKRGGIGSLTGVGASMAAPSPLAASTGLHYSHGNRQ